MKLVQIPKKTKGQFRTICVPNSEEKIKFINRIPELNEKSIKLCSKEIVHGFMPKKSPVTNALKHVGFKYTIRFDLSDFFDTVKPEHLKGKIPVALVEELMPDGRAYQGLPTSPIIANIAAVDMDSAILKSIGGLKSLQSKVIVYTRYADDLTFSTNQFELIQNLKIKIPQIVGRCGFRLNHKKTWIQDSRFGNRIITGIAVNDTGIVATKKTRKKLRAAIHQNNINSANGLLEWSKLKIPNKDKTESINPINMAELCKLWKLRKIHLNHVPQKQTEIHGTDLLISGDPVQILGLSNFATNWTSCMRHPSGMYHTGAPFWLYMSGTRIAGLMSGKTLTVAGFTRPTLRARALVHVTVDGDKLYDRVYGESTTAINELVKKLEALGYIHTNRYIPNSNKKKQIVGEVRKSLASAPYFDTLQYYTGAITDEDRKVFRLQTRYIF